MSASFHQIRQFRAFAEGVTLPELLLDPKEGRRAVFSESALRQGFQGGQGGVLVPQEQMGLKLERCFLCVGGAQLGCFAVGRFRIVRAMKMGRQQATQISPQIGILWVDFDRLAVRRFRVRFNPKVRDDSVHLPLNLVPDEKDFTGKHARFPVFAQGADMQRRVDDILLAIFTAREAPPISGCGLAQFLRREPQPHEIDQPDEAVAQAPRSAAHQIPDVEKTLTGLIPGTPDIGQADFLDQALFFEAGQLAADGVDRQTASPGQLLGGLRLPGIHQVGIHLPGLIAQSLHARLVKRGHDIEQVVEIGLDVLVVAGGEKVVEHGHGARIAIGQHVQGGEPLRLFGEALPHSFDCRRFVEVGAHAENSRQFQHCGFHFLPAERAQFMDVEEIEKSILVLVLTVRFQRQIARADPENAWLVAQHPAQAPQHVAFSGIASAGVGAFQIGKQAVAAIDQK